MARSERESDGRREVADVLMLRSLQNGADFSGKT